MLIDIQIGFLSLAYHKDRRVTRYFIGLFFLALVCQIALGMETRAISDAQITASTSWGSRWNPIWGRLHVKETTEHEGAWKARINDVHQWLQVDLGSQKTNVTRIATQGRHGVLYHWVKTYNLQYSRNGVYFENYTEQGRNDSNKVRTETTIDCPFY